MPLFSSVYRLIFTCVGICAKGQKKKRRQILQVVIQSQVTSFRKLEARRFAHSKVLGHRILANHFRRHPVAGLLPALPESLVRVAVIFLLVFLFLTSKALCPVFLEANSYTLFCYVIKILVLHGGTLPYFKDLSCKS